MVKDCRTSLDLLFLGQSFFCPKSTATLHGLIYDDGKGNLKRSKIFPNCGCDCSIKLFRNKREKSVNGWKKLLIQRTLKLRKLIINW